MAAFVRNIMLWLAFSFLLLHSLVPHHHHDHEDCNQTHFVPTHQSQNPLAIIFQTQLGAGHLEHFLVEQTEFDPADFLFLCCQNAIVFTSTLSLEVKETLTKQDLFFLTPLFEKQHPLRAPPFFS